MFDITPKEFAADVRLPGWYFDSSGCYCLNLGRFLICIFQNSFDGALEITVDTLSPEGFYDCNLEWETPEDKNELIQLAGAFTLKYARKKD